MPANSSNALSNDNYNFNFDCIKFVLSIMIVAIHSSLLPTIMYPWLRTAVPLFFSISSYFLFQRTAAAGTYEDKKLVIKNYIIRSLKLYGFWLIVLLPVTVYVRWDNFTHGILMAVLLCARDFLFSSTYIASWFIMASVLCALVLFVLSKYMSNRMILIISMIIYILTSVRSSYMFLFEEGSAVVNAFNVYDQVFTVSYNSFPAGLFWMALGKAFAEKKIIVNKHVVIPGIIISAALLYCEWLIVRHCSDLYRNDCYIMLIPLCTMLFAWMYQLPQCCKHRNTGTKMRKLSVIIYSVHGSMIPVLSAAFSLILGIEDVWSPVIFGITVVICTVIGLIIIWLQKKKGFRWLKNAY